MKTAQEILNQYKVTTPDGGCFVEETRALRAMEEYAASRVAPMLSAVPSEERRCLATMIGLAEAYLELFQSDDRPSKAMLVLDRKIIDDAKEILRRGIAG